MSNDVHDIWDTEYHPLDALFRPGSIAVIGATERPGSIGQAILSNLLDHGYQGTVYPVNPHYETLLDRPAYPTIADLPQTPDLAIIATPAATVPDIAGQCAAVGVKGAIIISAGFKETGPAGAALENEIMAATRPGHMRILGPNCLGIMNPLVNLNATFAAGMARPGSVAFLSQSGALCSAVLDWSLRENVGFSAFVSTGSMLDIGWGDLIDYLGNDPKTRSIILYMETIGNARAFMSAAREVALSKPVIVIKAGRSPAAAQAAASHTGSLVGDDEVLAAALRRCGVLRVEHISELFDMAEVLSKQPRPRGKRLAVITNAGGPGVLAADELLAGGGELAPLSAETIAGLDEFLPAAWSRGNPVDLIGDADAGRFARALEVVAQDPAGDGLLVILAPQALSDPAETARVLTPYAHRPRKPLLASWMGGERVAEGERLLNEAQIPTFAFPDTASRVFNYMWRYNEKLRALYETAGLPTDSEVEDWRTVREAVAGMIAEVRAAGRTLLSEYESKRILAAYAIPAVPTHLAESEETAVTLAREVGFPVVLKLHSHTLSHKTDVGGVHLDLREETAVRAAYGAIEEAAGEHLAGVTVQPHVNLSSGYELILGSSVDPQFGPVLLFGAGGTLVEVFRDHALGLPPLTTTLARRMIEETRIFRALQGVRGRAAVDVPALERLLVRFSILVVEHPWIQEIDINPLFASGAELLALDARIVLHPPETPPEALPRPAIRPYPTQYIWQWTTAGGVEVRIRPVHPADEPKLVRFHETLSELTVYQRYFQALQYDQRVAHERLIRRAFIDYDREMVLIATYDNPTSGERDIAGVGRLNIGHTGRDAEFALLISDAFQRHGLGTELLRCLLRVAEAEGILQVVAYMLPTNRGMRRICEKLGFDIQRQEDMTVATIQLSPGIKAQ